jgi:hypothetical protein
MYSCVKRALNATFMTIVVAVVGGMCSVLQAADNEQAQTIKGVVQQQDLRRVPQAVIEVKNQTGDMVSSGVSNDAGEFKVAVPEGGTYSVSAVQETYRSEYVVLTLGGEPVNPVTLTLSKTKEVSRLRSCPLCRRFRPKHRAKPIRSAARKSTSFRGAITMSFTM